MAGQQVGDRAIGGAFLSQFNDDVLCGNQFLEFLWPARSKFLDGFADFAGIKRGHKIGKFWTWSGDGLAMEWTCTVAAWTFPGHS